MCRFMTLRTWQQLALPTMHAPTLLPGQWQVHPDAIGYDQLSAVVLHCFNA